MMTPLKRQALEQRLDAVEVGWIQLGFGIDKNHGLGGWNHGVLHIVLLRNVYTNSFF